MKILWICNEMLPPIAEHLNIPASPKEGWVQTSLLKISKLDKNIKFAVATTYKGRQLIKKEIDNIIYYCLPLGKRDRTKSLHFLQNYWEFIKKDFNPDIVHIHGSEFYPGYEWCEINGYDNVVLSIQGLISGITRYYKGGMPRSIKYLSFRDIIRKDYISLQIKKWYKRGLHEQDFIEKLQHIIGRTDWDKSHIWALNPKANYYYVGETLRSSFYENKWDYNKCRPYSIFISQGGYPLKGADMVIKAMPFILRHFPDAIIRIAGDNILETPWYRKRGYGMYISHLIKKLHLEDKVKFLGTIGEKEMCDEYLSANIYICPSSVENSPNSLGEAQVLGVPHLATFAGGIPEITGYNPKVLYRFEEVEMLAFKVCEIFEMKNDYVPQPYEISRYDGDLNAKLLLNTYSRIVSEND